MINEETLNETLEQNDTAMEEAEVAHADSEESAPKQAPTHSQADIDKERNFRALREKADRIQKERDEMARQLKELQKKADRDPDDLVEARYVNDKIAQLEQKMYMNSTESRLKYELPDIESVVNEKNLQALVEREPELAAAINSSTDFYAKAKAAYKAIKQFGIIQDPAASADRERAQANATKPRAGAQVTGAGSDSPLTRAHAFANGLTDDLKKQLWKEMVDSRRKT